MFAHMPKITDIDIFENSLLDYLEWKLEATNIMMRQINVMHQNAKAFWFTDM